MSMNAIRQLNSGGLKLKSNFSAKTIARNISSNKYVATAMLQSSNYTGYASGPFVKARPIGRQARYMGSVGLSSWANRGRGQNFSYGGPITSGSVVYSQQISGSDTSNSFAQFLGTAAALAPGIMSMVSSNKSSSSSEAGASQQTHKSSKSAGDDLLNKTNLSNTTISSGSSDVQGLLNSMRAAGAQDSGTLRGSIAQANAELSEMQALTPEIQAEAQYADNTLKPEAERFLADANKEVDSAKTAEGEANAGVKGAELGVDKAKSTLQQAMKNKGIKKTEYIDARTNLTLAKTNQADAETKANDAANNLISKENTLKTASEKLANAESELSRISKTNQDGTPNPEYIKAKANVEKLKLEKQKAQIEKDQALNAKENADRALTKAKENLTKAQDEEQKAKELLSEADKQLVKNESAFKKEEEGLAKAQKGLNTAKTNQQQATDQLKLAQEKEKSVKEYVQKVTDTAGKLQTHLKDVQNLENGIQEANKQLEKLVAKEAKEKEKADDKIADNNTKNKDLETKHNFFDDKTSKKEQKAWNKRNANSSENQRLTARSQTLGTLGAQATDYANLAAGNPDFTTATGHTYTADTSKGIYLRDGIPTTKEDYDKAKLAYNAQ